MRAYNGVIFPNVPKSITWLTFYEILDSHQYDKLIPITEGMTVVDIGASMGIFSLYAAQKVGASGRVIAFEPESTSYNALLENIKANGFTNVFPYQKGVWSECGYRDICPSSFIEGTTMVNCKSGVKVDTCRLDKILPTLGVKHVDFVKIDTEGAANEILKGATDYLDRIDNFAIAAYHTGENPFEMIKLLQSRGFRTRLLHRFSAYSYVYATRNPNLTLQSIETWQILVALGTLSLVSYAIWKKTRKSN